MTETLASKLTQLVFSARRRVAGGAAALLALGTQAQAAEPAPQPGPPEGTLQAFSIAGSYSGQDSAALLAWRVLLPGGLQLGVDARGAASRESYIDGYAAKGGQAWNGTVRALVPLLSTQGVDFGLGVAVGARALSVESTLASSRQSLALTSELAPQVHLHLAPWLTARAGWSFWTHFQMSPSFDLDALGQIILLGATVPVSDSVQLFADFETGGLLGYGGDGGKYLTRGTLGVRLVTSGAANRWMRF